MQLITSDQASTQANKIQVGISACLLGENVRFNGGHKQSKLCLNQLGQFFEFKPFCPEVAIGLGIPRRPIRLVGDPDAPRAVGTDEPDLDVTIPLKQYAHKSTALCRTNGGIYSDEELSQLRHGAGQSLSAQRLPTSPTRSWAILPLR